MAQFLVGLFWLTDISKSVASALCATQAWRIFAICCFYVLELARCRIIRVCFRKFRELVYWTGRARLSSNSSSLGPRTRGQIWTGIWRKLSLLRAGSSGGIAGSWFLNRNLRIRGARRIQLELSFRLSQRPVTPKLSSSGVDGPSPLQEW